MLTVPLGAALTADSVFSEMKEELEEKTQKKEIVSGIDNPTFQVITCLVTGKIIQPSR